MRAKIFLFLLFIVLSFFSCSHREVNQKYLEGTWQFMDENEYFEYAFNKDKIMVYSSFTFNHTELDYTLNRNTLYIRRIWLDSSIWPCTIEITDDQNCELSGIGPLIFNEDTFSNTFKYELKKIDPSSLEYYDCIHPIEKHPIHKLLYRHIDSNYMEALIQRESYFILTNKSSKN